MSGHLLRYNSQSRAFVRQGHDGKFATKVLTNSTRTQPQAPAVQGKKMRERTVLSPKGK